MLFLLVFLNLLLFTMKSSGYLNISRGGTSKYNKIRDQKFFFAVLKIASGPCTTTDNQPGVCKSSLNACISSGGHIKGSCADGFGVCCHLQVTCGGMITVNGTTFVNPDSPNPTNTRSKDFSTCELTIRRPSNGNICQVKLKYNSFEILGPPNAETGLCPRKENIAISSGYNTPQIPTICGDLDGQHMHVDFGLSDTVTLTINLDPSNASFDRRWKITVYLLQCNHPLLAPSGCLQYYQGIKGEAKIFNYPNANHLANLNYRVCWRVEAGMTSMAWSACMNDPRNIALTGTAPSTPPSPPSNRFQYGAENCAGDHLAFRDFVDPTVPLTPGEPATYEFHDGIICGFGVGPLIQNTAPFVMQVVSDGTDSGDTNNRGFCLDWTQQPQTVPVG